MQSASDHTYVVVGGGSAGCVLANRLSADPSDRVLLLEAGGDNRDLLLRNPGASMLYAIGNPRFDWLLRAEPDPTRGGRMSTWNRGRGLGGSSAINGMVYLRGHPADYEQWRVLGNPGWGWDDVLAAYRRLEDSELGSPDVRGKSGPQRVERIRTVHPLTRAFVESAAAAGLARRESLNELETEGVALAEATQHRGRRCSSAHAFIAPVRRRPNLEIVTDARALSLAFEGSRVTGVWYERGGERHLARARLEVVLSAGAIESPHLLLASGVGDAQALQDVGVPVAHHLPGVGRHMMDHVETAIVRRATRRTLNQELGPYWMARHGFGWLVGGRGPAASPGADALAFARTVPGLPSPDVLVYFGPYGAGLDDSGVEVIEAPAITLDAGVCHPRSRGEVRLRSADPREPALILPRLLDDEEDVGTMVRGVRLIERILEQRPLADFVAGPYSPDSLRLDDADLVAYVRAVARPSLHTAGTCRMGPDANAVVDARLRVRGLAGVRVADAAVIPYLPGCNLNAVALMIGQRAAELLLEERRTLSACA